MAGDNNIRFTKNDRKEYSRLVRNTKAKIRRTQRNYGVDLTGEIEIPKIEEFDSREQFNRWKHKQKSFTSVSNRNFQFRKNEWDVVATKKELDEIQTNTKKAQEIAEKLIKRVERNPAVEQRMRQMAKPQNLTGISRPTDFDFSTIRSRTQLEKRMKSMKDRASEKFFDKRMEQMQENFIKLLETTFNSDADELVERLKNIPPDDFYEIYLFLSSDQGGGIDFSYIYTTEASGEETNHVIAKIMSQVEQYEQGELNMDLKGF